MMEGNYQHFFSVFLGSVLYLTSYFFEYKGDLDFPSFYHAKVNQMIFPPSFPKNDSDDLKLWREIYSLQPANVSNFGIGTVDVHTDLFGDSGMMQIMRIYNSNHSMNNAKGTALRDVLVWLHDGYWMLGDAQYENEICFKLAQSTGFVVVSASYRLAPEYTFPTPLTDVQNILKWVRDNIGNYGAHPQKLILAGEGSGGNLAAATAAINLDLKRVPIDDRISVIGLLLVHPPLSMFTDGESYIEHGHFNGRMTTAQLNWAKSMYRGSYVVKPNDYTFAPLVATPALLKLFPNTIIVLAKNDILYDEGVKFGQMLEKKYVPVHTLVYNSTIYGFFGRSIYPQGDIAMKDAAYHLKIISETYPESYFFDEDDVGGELPPFPGQFP